MRGPGSVLLAVGFLLFVPLAGATTFQRAYEASATYAGDGTSFRSAYMCAGGQDTVHDLGGCVAYHVPGAYDLRGTVLTVRIVDRVFGTAVWGVVVVDLDGDTRSDCAVDLCFSGRGTILGQVPLDAAGRYVRVYPATMHTEGGLPETAAATNGLIHLEFV